MFNWLQYSAGRALNTLLNEDFSKSVDFSVCGVKLRDVSKPMSQWDIYFFKRAVSMGFFHFFLPTPKELTYLTVFLGIYLVLCTSE